MTRSEIAAMSTTALDVHADGIRGKLERAWARGESGGLAAVYDLALIETELTIRGMPWRPLHDASQTRLFDVDRHGNLIDAA